MVDVPRKATPVSQAEAVRLLPPAFLAAGLPLTVDAARLFLALVFLENGRGQKLYNHNWGNLAAGASWQGDVWRPEWYRQADIDGLPQGDRRTRLQDLHDRMGRDVPSGFRAYASSAEGLQAFARLFATDRYKPLLAAAHRGSPGEFAAAIRSTGYTPDLDVPAHTQSYLGLLREFEKQSYFVELPRKLGADSDEQTPVSAGGAGNLLPLFFQSSTPTETSGPHWVPLAFEARPGGADDKSIHVAVPRCKFRIRKLQSLNALGNGMVLDMRVKRDGKSYSCLPTEVPLPARVLVDAPRFELPPLQRGDEVAIYVTGTVSAFVAWGEVEI